MVNADGTGLHRITPKAGSDERDPDWSPDGTTIAFLASTDSGSMIATMDADGGNRQLLGAGFGKPSWSPDGGKLVFLKYRHGQTDVFVMNADGTGVTANRHAQVRVLAHLLYGRDQDRIQPQNRALANHDVWIVTQPGGVFTRLTDTPNRDEVGLSWQAT